MPKRKQAIAAAETPATRFTAEIGRSGIKEFGGIVHEEFDADLRGINGIKIYEEMRRNDPTIAVGLRAIGWLIGQVNWSVEPGGETREDEEAAAFLESCIHDMSHTWSKVIRDALTCLPFGWSWLEMVMKVRNGIQANPASRYDDGRIGWRKFTLCGQSSWSRWEFDERGGVAGLWQQGDLIGGKYQPETLIPIDKSVLFRLEDEKGNPNGVSLLRPVFNAWYAKKQIQEVEAIGIERDLTGTLIIHMPVGATSTDYSKARDLVEQFKADDMAGFIAPRFGAGEHEGWRFEIINSPGSKAVDPDKVIQRYQLEIARSFLAQFLMLGQGSAGSWALARDQRGIFEVALGAILMNFDETINRFMVPPLFRLNDFGRLTALPQFKPGRISKADMDKFSKGLAALATAGLLTPDADLERYVREEMDLPELVEVETDEEQPTEDTGQDEPAEAKRQREPYQLAGGHVGHKGQHAPHTGGSKGKGGSVSVVKELEVDSGRVREYVVTEHNGTRILVPKDLDTKKQKLTVDDVKSHLNEMPEAYRDQVPEIRLSDEYATSYGGMKVKNASATYYTAGEAGEGGKAHMVLHRNDKLDRVKADYPGTIRHETAHAIKDKQPAAFEKDWKKAMKKDGDSISAYARTNIEEDIAETIKFHWSPQRNDRRQVDMFFSERAAVLKKYGIKPGG